MADQSLPERQAPAFSFYAKDFIAGTLTLSLAERGAYITLLAYQWDNGKVPNDPIARARILGCPPRQSDALWLGIAGKFFQCDDGAWRNARLEGERLKQAERRAALALNGAKGGRPRNQQVKQTKTKRFPLAKPNDNQNKSLSSSSSSSYSDQSVDKEHLQTDAAAEEVGIRGEDIRAFIARFCELYSKHRFGAKYMVRREKDIPLVKRLLHTYPAARLEKLTTILLTTDHEWVTSTDRGIGILSIKAAWLDSLLSEHEARKTA